MKAALIKTREIYYKERKKIRFRFSDYPSLIKPNWMVQSNDNRFDATYRDQKILIKEGRIVLGKIVQANTLLFQPGKYDSPAAMVFSEDGFFEEHPEELARTAHLLFNIKGVNCDDKELQSFSDLLEDEIATLFNTEVPKILSCEKKVLFTTFMVHRKHLPRGYIDFSYFPCLICPEKTEASIILPSKYWSSEFLESR